MRLGARSLKPDITALRPRRALVQHCGGAEAGVCVLVPCGTHQQRSAEGSGRGRHDCSDFVTVAVQQEELAQVAQVQRWNTVQGQAEEAQTCGPVTYMRSPRPLGAGPDDQPEQSRPERRSDLRRACLRRESRDAASDLHSGPMRAFPALHNGRDLAPSILARQYSSTRWHAERLVPPMPGDRPQSCPLVSATGVYVPLGVSGSAPCGSATLRDSPRLSGTVGHAVRLMLWAPSVQPTDEWPAH